MTTNKNDNNNNNQNEGGGGSGGDDTSRMDIGGGVKRSLSTDELMNLAADNLSHCLFGITVLPDDSGHSQNHHHQKNHQNNTNEENDDDNDNDDEIEEWFEDDDDDEEDAENDEKEVVGSNESNMERNNSPLTITNQEGEQQQQQQQHLLLDSGSGIENNEMIMPTRQHQQQQQQQQQSSDPKLITIDINTNDTNDAEELQSTATVAEELSLNNNDDDEEPSPAKSQIHLLHRQQQQLQTSESSSNCIQDDNRNKNQDNDDNNNNNIVVFETSQQQKMPAVTEVVVTDDDEAGEDDGLLGSVASSQQDDIGNEKDNGNHEENENVSSNNSKDTSQQENSLQPSTIISTTIMTQQRRKPRKGRRRKQQQEQQRLSGSSSSLLNDNSCRANEWFKHPGMWKERRHVVDVKRLRKIVTSGIVEEGSHRAVAWRVLFGYLPPDNALWESTLREKRQVYADLVHTLFVDTSDADDGTAIKGRRRRRSLFLERQKSSESFNSDSSSAYDDNDNNPNDPSNGMMITMKKKQSIPKKLIEYWKKNGKDLRSLERISHDINALRMDMFYDDKNNNNHNTKNSEDDSKSKNDDNNNKKDLEEKFLDFADSVSLLDEIHRDVIRTHPEMSFFLEPAGFLGKRRYAAIERILFIWSKYNKGVRYVQGMNEIVGILYFVLSNDQNDEWAAGAEPDTYWLLHTILAEMQDVFVPDLDNADTGIQGRIQAMHALLTRHDPEVAEHLDELGLEVSYYAVRWWTTLLSREFLLPDTIRLWDSMFASTHKDNFLRYICVTMIMCIRDDLLKGDFSICLKMLQAYPSTHTDHLLEACRALWLYESQITVACHRCGISLHQALCTVQSPPALIMAFGLKNGKPPVSRTERAMEKAEQTVQKVTTSAQGMFGRALGFYQRYSSSNNRARSRSDDSGLESAASSANNNNQTAGTTTSAGIEEQQQQERKSSNDYTASDEDKTNSVERNPEEDIYLNAILNA